MSKAAKRIKFRCDYCGRKFEIAYDKTNIKLSEDLRGPVALTSCPGCGKEARASL